MEGLGGGQRLRAAGAAVVDGEAAWAQTSWTWCCQNVLFAVRLGWAATRLSAAPLRCAPVAPPGEDCVDVLFLFDGCVQVFLPFEDFCME